MEKIKFLLINIFLIFNVYSQPEAFVNLGEEICASFNSGPDGADYEARKAFFREKEDQITSRVIEWIYGKYGIVGTVESNHFPLYWYSDASFRSCYVWYVYGSVSAGIACQYLQNFTIDKTGDNYHTKDLRYLNNLPGCEGYERFEIVSAKCYELGFENPLKPINLGAPVDNGKWVRVIFTLSNGLNSYDSTVQTVLSGGCAGVEIDGQPMRKSNAYDSSFTMDGATINICSYDGKIYSGTCAENGLNTQCGGQVPFTYGNNNDSILNDCFGYGSINDIDTSLKRPGQDLQIQSDSALSGSEYSSGINHLSSEIRAENALNREILNKQLEEQKKSNNLLNTIKGALAGISNSIKNLLSVPDSASISQKLSGFENSGLIDSTGFDLNIGDSLQIIQGIRDRFLNDTLTDTIEYKADSAGISEIFEGFTIDFGTTDCDCNPEWFHIDIPNFVDFYIDICPYNVDTMCKYIFKILAAIVLFVFYRNTIYNTLNELFE